ncbi:hypothetical protein ACIA8B_02825 [Micromonospora chalcea]
MARHNLDTEGAMEAVAQLFKVPEIPGKARRFPASEDIVDEILEALLRKGFRRRVGEKRREGIRASIRANVQDGTPINLVIPFGGYKHFWNPSAPNPDWAEVIHLKRMVEYILPVLQLHGPGVRLEYVSEDVVIPRMNNYSVASLDTYASGFERVIGWYSRFLPKGLSLNFWRIGDVVDREALIELILDDLPRRRALFNNLPDDQKTASLRRSHRSVVPGGSDGRATLSYEHLFERIVESRLIEQAFSDIAFSPQFVGNYYESKNRICICFSYGMSADNDERQFLTINGSRGSMVDFWVGRGVSIYDGRKARLTILSRRQHEALAPPPHLLDTSEFGVPLTTCDKLELLATDGLMR